MTKSLRQNFISVAMLFLFGVVFVLIAIIYIGTDLQINDEIDDTLNYLADNNGEFEELTEEDAKKYGIGVYAERIFTTRYFVVEVYNEGTVGIHLENIASVSNFAAKDYAIEVLKRGKKRAYIDEFKYIVQDIKGGKQIIFLDCHIQLQTKKMVTGISILVAISVMVLVLIIVFLVSGIVIKPFIENIEQQNRFITDAGHELKTPLAIISANADVLELTSGNNEWVESIRNQTIRLNGLVKELLMLSKMGENDMKSQFEEFNISETMENSIQPFYALARTRDLTLTKTIEPDLIMIGSKAGMERIISILLDNAMKYSAANGDIKVTLGKKRRHVEITVSNPCENLENSDLKKIFDRFYRTDEARTQKSKGGYGIGLSVAQSIVNVHNGKIVATFDGKKRVKFTVTV